MKNPLLEKDGQSKRFQGFTTDILTDHAIEFVRNNREGPFLRMQEIGDNVNVSK